MTRRRIAELLDELEVATHDYEIANTDPTGEAEAAEAAQRVADACVALRHARGWVAKKPRSAPADQFGDEFAPYLAGQLRDPEVRAAYEAEQRDSDEVIQFGHPRWGL